MLKDEFKFHKEENQWVKYPFVIDNEDFIQIDWKVFTDSFNRLSDSEIKIKNESKFAIFQYAKFINFFTKEELEDLEFGIFDIELQISNSLVSGFIVSYGVEENEKSKFHWKDVYGIWKVFFKGNKIVNVLRE